MQSPLDFPAPRVDRRRLLQGGFAALLTAGLSPLRAFGWTTGEFENAPTTHEQIRQDATDAPLAIRFDGSTAREFADWRRRFSTKLRELLGPHDPPAQWETIVEERVELDGHTRERIVLAADGHPRLPMYRLLPRPLGDQPRPGVLAIHGHSGFHPVAGRDDLPGVAKQIEAVRYDYGRRMALRGYIVAVPCLTPFEPREDRASYGNQDPCAVAFVRMQLLGKLLMAENLRDCLWCIELLARDERVDAERLGCLGLSYGGRMTMLTAALEPRIKVAAVSGALNMMQERIGLKYSCGAQVIPGLLKYGDVPEIGSLIAPRSCVWEVGARDGLIKPDWAKKAEASIRRAYAAAGAGERVRFDHFEGGHRWNGDVAEPLFDELLRPGA
ncbi:MAG: prolyl oligopeptidase family serine peptidase [Planctomycetaceae bacterium]